MNVMIATGNKHKLREFREMLSFLQGHVMGSEVSGHEETEDNFFGNSRLKATYVAQSLAPCSAKTVVLADDSGLRVDFLKGAPGVYSARYAGEGVEDGAHVKKLLGKMRRALDFSCRSARMSCALTLIVPRNFGCDELACFKAGSWVCQSYGSLEGWIAYHPRSEHKDPFGYDPVFIPHHSHAHEHSKTLAELSSGEKNASSHRKKALEVLFPLLKNLKKSF